MKLHKKSVIEQRKKNDAEMESNASGFDQALQSACFLMMQGSEQDELSDEFRARLHWTAAGSGYEDPREYVTKRFFARTAELAE